jgi:hypothetical protein
MRPLILVSTTGLLCVVLALGCSKDRSSAATESSTAAPGIRDERGAGLAANAPPPTADLSAQAVVGGIAGAVSGSGARLSIAQPARNERQIPQGGPFSSAADATITPSMVIRTGQATLEVRSLDDAITRVRQLAQQVGGFVANSSVQSGRDRVRSASIEIKVPASRFDELVTGLSPIGKVESVNTAAEDVGEEFVDLTARANNSRRLEARLLDLLATRTGKLADVLEVEQQLARVREEIERYDGRLRYLRTRAAVSTLTVAVHEPSPLLAARPGESPMREAFEDAWRNFVGFTAGFIAVLGVAIPLALLGWLAWVVLRRFLPKRGGGGNPTPGVGGNTSPA